MRWIINYIRSCFCKHEWEYLGRANYFRKNEDRPCKSIAVGVAQNADILLSLEFN